MFLYEWIDYWSPIEKAVWQEIRSMGHFRMFPQVPVLQYFIDFGDPYQKIGIEMDGKQHDIEKDRIRDKKIYDETGWIIFRIKGTEINYLIEGELTKISYEINQADCWDKRNELQDKYNELYIKYIMNTDSGVLEAIKFFYPSYEREFDKDDENLWLYRETLSKHCLIDLHYEDIMRTINKPKIERQRRIMAHILKSKIKDEFLGTYEPIVGVYTFNDVEDSFDEKKSQDRFEKEKNRISELLGVEY